MMSAVILKTKESDANLVICIGMITLFSEHCVRKDVQLLIDFPNAPFTVSYLVNTLIAINVAEIKGSLSEIEIINFDDGRTELKPRTNESMVESVKEKIAVRKTSGRSVASNLLFGWANTAAKAFGKKSMMIVVSECCKCNLSGATLEYTIKSLGKVSSIPLYIDPFSFKTPDTTDRTLNSVKTFSSLVSLCFLYVGPNCIHTQIAALMGVPVFVLDENLNDNRFSVAITTKEFKTAHSVLDVRHGSSIFPKAYRFWSAHDRSFS